MSQYDASAAYKIWAHPMESKPDKPNKRGISERQLVEEYSIEMFEAMAGEWLAGEIHVVRLTAQGIETPAKIWDMSVEFEPTAHGRRRGS